MRGREDPDRKARDKEILRLFSGRGWSQEGSRDQAEELPGMTLRWGQCRPSAAGMLRQRLPRPLPPPCCPLPSRPCGGVGAHNGRQAAFTASVAPCPAPPPASLLCTMGPGQPALRGGA